MKKKIGRNELCPCGSGKKYKQCCIPQSTSSNQILDLSWQRLRNTEGSVVDNHLLPYLTNKLPKDVADFAMTVFFPKELPREMNIESLFRYFFMPWLLFNWIPNNNFGIKNFNPLITIANNYMVQNGSKLSQIEKKFITAMNNTYYSYYCILEVELGKSLLVKDILLGTTHKVKENQGTYQL